VIFIDALKLTNTPMHIEYKSGDNPFKDKKNVLKPWLASAKILLSSGVLNSAPAFWYALIIGANNLPTPEPCRADDALKLTNTPMHIEYKSGDNPFKDKKNVLNARQIAKKRRLMEIHRFD
jgi:hypothetical protein